MGAADVVRRYWALSGLFGCVFGVRFTLDLWILRELAAGTRFEFEFIGITLAGMLIGELASGPTSDRVGRRAALHLSTAAILAWALLAAAALTWANPVLLVAGALLFGIGFGLFHSSLDAWFAASVCATGESAALELRLTQGYLCYNFGYLVGSSLAFPLLLGFRWNADLLATAGALFAWPYLLALAMLAAIVVLTLQKGRQDRAAAALPIRGATLRLRDTVSPGQILHDYRTILHLHRKPLWGVLFVASSIALIVQLIDHLAPAILLPGATLKDKAINIVLFNATICLCVGALQVFLQRMGGAEGLRPTARAGIIKLALAAVVLLLLACFLASDPSDRAGSARWIGLALGMAQAILLMLPPLMKAWALEFNVGARYATTLAVLGVSKRLFAIVATFSLPWLAAVGGAMKPAGQTVALYGFTASVAVITLGILFLILPASQRAA